MSQGGKTVGSRPPARPSGPAVVAVTPNAPRDVGVTKVVKGRPKAPPTPKKVASGVPVTPVASTQVRTQEEVAFQGRKHSDTLAALPVADKLRAFETSSAGDSRRNFWLQRAEEKKAAPGGHRAAPQGKAPTPPPAKRAPVPEDPSRMSVRASPAGVGNLKNVFQQQPHGAQPGTPKAAPRSAAPKPPVPKKAPPKKVSNAPPPKALPVPVDDAYNQDEEELRAFELQQQREEEAARAAVEEERRRRAAEEERRKQEELKRQQEEERRRKEEEERKRKEAQALAEKKKREAEEAAARKRREAEEAERKRLEAERAKAAGGRAIEVLITIADFAGNSQEGELTFGEGDYIMLMKRDDSGWWQGEINAEVGWFPSNFVRELSDEEYEEYCAQFGVEPYFDVPEEPVKPVVAAKPAPVPAKAPEPVKTASKTPAVTAAAPKAAAAAAAAAPAKSKPLCAQCQQPFATEAEQVAFNDVVLHGRCLTPYRKAKGDNKSAAAAAAAVDFGKLPTSMADFDVQGLLGKGRFGKVYQCRKKDTGKVYAIKALLKSHIYSSEAQRVLVEREKSILQKINGPFLVRCYHIFEDDEKLYFVMECASGGELFVHLSRERSFDPERVRFYAAEMFLGLEYLHGMGIVYRDMKPENVLLTAEGHILMTDFGISKEGLDNNSMRTATFCGTPEYLAPEVLLGQGYGKAVDWWSYGSVVYEMLTGLPPYYSDDITEMYKKILQAPLDLPHDFDQASRDFLSSLLDRNPDKRLQDPRVIRRHAYFKGVNWDAMYNMQVPAPYLPEEEFVYDDEDEFLGSTGGDGGAQQQDDDFADFDGQVYDQQEDLGYDPNDGQIRCRSLHNWDAENEGDLSLREGDVIIILDNQSDPSGWWQGQNIHGEVGVFPSNLIEML